MSRPSLATTTRKRNLFLALVADDFRLGGLPLAHRNVTNHARTVRLDPWLALKLSYDPWFVGEVARLARQRSGEQLDS